MKELSIGRRGTLLALSVALAGMLALTGCAASAYAGGRIPNSISVSGVGEASGMPDLAYVELGVDEASEDAGQAVAEANRKMNEVVEAIGQLGVAPEDIQTTSLNLWVEEVANERDGGQVDIRRRYHTQNIVRIVVREVDDVGAVIEAGLDAGANQVLGLNFAIEDTSQLEQEARREAYADAQARAAELAEAAGLRLGKPVSISEGFVAVPGPYAYAVAESAVGFGGGGPPAVSGGQLQVTTQVNITFRTR